MIVYNTIGWVVICENSPRNTLFSISLLILDSNIAFVIKVCTGRYLLE